MINQLLDVNRNVAVSGRFSAALRDREHVGAADLAFLICCGAAAALAMNFVRLGLRLPGHAIVLAMIPMVLGLAFVPRRLSGFVMSSGAFATAAILSGVGLGRFGSGAFVSLCLLGPMMDLMLSRTKSGWKLYLGLMLSGLSTNLLALASRSSSKLLGLDLVGMRPFGGWWAQAAITYSLCGACAGLIAACIFFSLRKKREAL
jgi:hypothetical protein